MPPKRQISSEAIKMIKYKVLHCTDNINALPLQRIRNNVEAFRYYLALKSGQFQLTKIVAKLSNAVSRKQPVMPMPITTK